MKDINMSMTLATYMAKEQGTEKASGDKHSVSFKAHLKAGVLSDLPREGISIFQTNTTFQCIFTEK